MYQNKEVNDIVKKHNEEMKRLRLEQEKRNLEEHEKFISFTKAIKKMITNRYLLSILCVILEFIEITLLYLFLYKYFLPITILSIIFSIIVVIYIINHYKNTEMKLLWILIVFLLPIIGPLIFMLFVSNEQNKNLTIKSTKILKELKSYYENNEILEELKNENLDAYLQANYICNSNQVAISKYNKVTYFKIGEDFYSDLLINLKSAKKFIFMEYFIIEIGKMWNGILDILKERVNNDVEVYVMYDDVGCITTLPEKYYEELENIGIHCIPSNKITAKLNNIVNNRDHRKITVIDGKVGYTGGINLADEYINEIEKHGHWKDTAIKIEGPGVKNLMTLFIGFWNLQNKKELDYDKYKNIKYDTYSENGMIVSYGSGPNFIYKDDIAKNVYLNLINSAKKYLYITSPYLICDNEIMNALKLAAKKGVEVKIIVPHIPDKEIIFLMTKSNYKNLLDSGVKIYEYTKGFIHAKNIICDDIFSICGTINLDYRSLVYHFECATWMYKTNCVKDMKKDFLDTLNISQEVTSKDINIKGYKRIIVEIIKIFSPLF